MVFSQIDDFHFQSAILQSAIGGSILPGRNKKVGIINLITHVQGQHIRAQHVSYTGSLVTESQQVMRKVEITGGFFDTSI